MLPTIDLPVAVAVVGGEGAYNQRVSGTFDSDGVCDSRVTASILANNYSPPINSISLHSTGGTLV